MYYDSSDIEYDEINYKRKYIITDTNGKNYDIKDKNVIYVFKNKLISQNEIPEEINSFYPIRYYRMSEYREFENIDFIFLVDNSHQDRNGQLKLSKRILRKIERANRF